MIRLFAALEVPADARAALAGWAALLPPDPALRPVPVQNLHVTLVFLGAQPPEAVEAIGEAVVAAARAVGALAVTAGAWLPPRRPGVLVADLEGDVAALQGAVVAALRPWHEPEQRPFRPHVTVARVRRGQRPRAMEVPPPPAVRFAPVALVLYQSVLGRGGAVYEALASAPV